MKEIDEIDKKEHLFEVFEKVDEFIRTITIIFTSNKGRKV